MLDVQYLLFAAWSGVFACTMLTLFICLCMAALCREMKRWARNAPGLRGTAEPAERVSAIHDSHPNLPYRRNVQAYFKHYVQSA